MNNPPELPLSGLNEYHPARIHTLQRVQALSSQTKQQKKKRARTDSSPRNDVTPLLSLGFNVNNGSHLFSLGKGADAG